MSERQADLEEPAAFIQGEAAQKWFYSLGGGGTVLDDHLIAIGAAFGPNAKVRYRASVNRRTRRPAVLFIEIDRPADDEEALEALIEVQRTLLEEEANLAQRSRRRQPFANIVVTLGLPPENWAEFVDRADS